MRFLLLAVAVAALSSRPADVVDCFASAAFECIKKPAEKKHDKCCGECKGTGLVRSGDGLAWVSCPCPDTCECKKSCPDGKCSTKRPR